MGMVWAVVAVAVMVGGAMFLDYRRRHRSPARRWFGRARQPAVDLERGAKSRHETQVRYSQYGDGIGGGGGI